MNPATRIPVLMYHRVGIINSEAEARYCVSPDIFSTQMHALADKGFRAVPVDSFIPWLTGGPPLAQGDVVLTFDDGLLGVREHAQPVLAQLGWPFAVFLVADILGGVDEWNQQQLPNVANYPLLSPADVLEMQHLGCTFHSHTRTHTSLPTLDDDDLVSQLEGSRRSLERLLGRPVDCLAYPYGRVNDRVEAATRAAGYRAAFSVQPGFNRQHMNPFRIRRLDISGHDTVGMLLRKMHFGSNDGRLRNALGYYWRRVVNTMR